MALEFWVKQERQHREAIDTMTEALDRIDIVTAVTFRKRIRYHENERKNCLSQIEELS